MRIWSFFLTIFATLSCGSHFYVWLKMRTALVPVAWRVTFVLLGVLGTAATFIGRTTRGMLPDSLGRWPEIISNIGFVWFVLVVLLCLSLILVDLVRLMLLTAKVKITSRTALTIGSTLGLALFLWGLGEAYFVQRRDVEITSAKLPADIDRLRIVQLSDVHFGGLYTRSHLERALSIVREAQPDLIFLTGDLVDGDMRFWERERDMLFEINKTARFGAFAVNGNHESYSRWMYGIDTDAFIASCGFTLLTDKRIELPEINAVIIGFNDRTLDHFGSLAQPDDRDKLVFVLKHRPLPPDDAEGKFDLQLSGHTHGGQFWVFGPLSSRANGNSVQGLSSRAGGLIYLSNGTGFFGPPMRIATPPEVTVIDIIRATDSSAERETRSR